MIEIVTIPVTVRSNNHMITAVEKNNCATGKSGVTTTEEIDAAAIVDGAVIATMKVVAATAGDAATKTGGAHAMAGPTIEIAAEAMTGMRIAGMRDWILATIAATETGTGTATGIETARVAKKDMPVYLPTNRHI